MLAEFLSDEIRTSDFQFALKSGFSTTLCNFYATKTIQHFNPLGSPVISLFLDAPKALKETEANTLDLKMLLLRVVCRATTRHLFRSYQLTEITVKHNHVMSGFSDGNGVQQGSLLSLTLFSVNLDPLLRELRSC